MSGLGGVSGESGKERKINKKRPGRDRYILYIIRVRDK